MFDYRSRDVKTGFIEVYTKNKNKNLHKQKKKEKRNACLLEESKFIEKTSNVAIIKGICFIITITIINQNIIYFQVLYFAQTFFTSFVKFQSNMQKYASR